MTSGRRITSQSADPSFMSVLLPSFFLPLDQVCGPAAKTHFSVPLSDFICAKSQNGLGGKALKLLLIPPPAMAMDTLQ